MRIRGAKTELEEAGESTDGMAESTASLRKEIKALSGVDIMLNDNTFKSTYQIMDELSTKWEDLSDIAQASITELLAGKHQGNIMSSLMSNFDTARAALDTSLNSSGSAMAEHAKWSKSLEAQLLKLKATWQSLSQSFLQSDFLKVALDAVIGLVNGVDKLINTFGALPTFATLFGAYQSFQGKGFFKVIVDEATGAATGMTNVFSNAFNTIKTLIASVKSQNIFTFGEDFYSSLEADKKALERYQYALDSGMSKQDAFNKTMHDASPAAQQFAQTMEVTNSSILEFEEQQKRSQLAMQAQDKSLASCNSLINSYNNSMQLCGLSQNEFLQVIQTSNPALYQYLSGLNGASGSLKGYVGSLIRAKVATVALKAATTALNAVLSYGIGVIISAATKWITSLINAEEDLAERVDEVISKFKEQHKELISGKSSFKTDATRYAQLSKGVNDLGKNISLTTDEYSEYQSVVNKIADQLPSLISGYDSQGNAILGVKGNVEGLIKAYEDLIEAENRAVLNNSKDIQDDFRNAVNDANSNKTGFLGLDDKISIKEIEQLEQFLNGDYSSVQNKSYESYRWSLITQAMRNAGATFDNFQFSEGIRNGTYNADVIEEQFNKNKSAIKSVINNFYADLEAETEGMKSLATATISNAFDLSDSDFYGMNDTIKNVARQAVDGFDYKFFSGLIEDGKSVESYVNDMLAQLNKLNSSDIDQIEASFNLQTKFNNGDISYGEFVHGLEDAGSLIDGLNLSDDIKKHLKLSLGLNEDDLVEEYETLVNRLTDTNKDSISKGNIIGLGVEEAEKFIDGLSAEELSVITDIIPKLDANATAEQIQAIINRELAVQGLLFDLNLEVETASIDAFNTALKESASASGLSSDSIVALKNRYKELESEGYNLSAMFEETSNGVHLNREALRELEKAYAEQKQNDIKEDIESLKNEYDLLTQDINKCNDASERASLYVQRDAILQQINDAATLAAQYDGLTSSYNDWLAAEESGQERDMYEKLIEGLENVDDEISRGWLDDGTIEFLELLTGRDLTTASIEDLKKAYADLDKQIGESSYSIRDFFTVNEDGDSTNTGVYNFLETIESLGGKFKDVIKKKDGRIVGFDFKVAGGDEAIAKALGISEELVEIMLRAADDAGFVVNLEGAWTQLADLKTEAEAARDVLIDLKKNGLDKLKEFDVNFDLNADGKDLLAEQEKAVELLDKFRNTDGTINLELDGAQQALDIAEYLTIRLDDLTEPRYMQVDTSVLDDNLKEPVEKMQEFERLSKEKHLLTLTGDTKGVEAVNAEMSEIATYLDNIEDEETQIKLGIKGLSKEEIEEKLEKGEIELAAELNLDIQMSDDLKDMRLMMMNQLGLVSDAEVKLKLGYEIDDSAVDELTDKEQQVAVEFIAANEEEFNKLTDEEKDVVVDLAVNEDALSALEYHQVTIEAFAEVFGVEKVDDLKKKLDNLTDEQIQILAQVLGRIDVEKLKSAINGLDNKTVEAIAKAFGEGDVEGLKSMIEGLDDKTVKAIAEAFGYDDVNDLYAAIDNLDPKTVQAIAEALGIKDVDSLKAAIDRLSDKNVEAVATVSGKDDIDNLKTAIDSLKDKTITVWASIKKKASDLWSNLTGGNSEEGGSGLNGTAHAYGTSGIAFKQGDWRTKKTETALVGELGREIVVTPDNRWHTVGDNGAEFANIPRGSIIFNHRQTEELLSNGKVTSNGGRGKAYASGTAYAHVVGSHGVGGGTGKVEGANKKQQEEIAELAAEKAARKVSERNSASSGSSGSGGGTDKNNDGKAADGNATSSGGSSSEEEREFEESFDWIEIAISRIERAIDSLDKKTNNVYKSWSERNSALSQEIGKVGEEIGLQETAAQKYLQEANSIGLDSSYAAMVRNGAINIEDFEGESDEALVEKIKEYQELYEKYLDCVDAAEELREKEAELNAQRVENVAAQYEGILNVIEHEKNILDEYIAQSEANAQLISVNYYNALVRNEKENLSKLEEEKAKMLSEMQVAMNSGTIAKYSEAWYEMVNSIDEVTLAIAESETQLKEYEQTIQQLSWGIFDLLQEKISSVTEETEFLIELMSSDKLYDDKGQLTDEGLATIGQHGVAYNTHMYQADQARAEAERLKKQMDFDPFDTELEKRYREMIALQQEHIIAAQDEKEAIRDMVSEGIELELDALQELIDKKNEALESVRDLYEYQRKVKEQTEEIASLEKQMAAYSGDNSEEAKQKIQKIKVELETARQDLQESEYDKFISDSAALLDELYLEYEEILNMRLDNLDALVADVITEINTGASSISATISEKVDSVGYTLSESMNTIWDTNSTKITDVITVYGSKFESAQTTTNNALGTINANLQNMISQLNSIANTNVNSASTSSAANSPQANSQGGAPSYATGNNTSNKTSVSDDTLRSIAAAIWVYGTASGWGNNPERKQKLTEKFGEANAAKVQSYINSEGSNGKLYSYWTKNNKSINNYKYSAFKQGARRVDSSQLAWTQENGGREFIIRPSDGAILTPVAKGDSVLNSFATENIWKMANDPVGFIRNNLNLESPSAPNSLTVHSNYNQYLDKVVFNFPGIQNYDEMLHSMRKDKNFERLILSMSIDKIAGRNGLAKGKSIR